MRIKTKISLTLLIAAMLLIILFINVDEKVLPAAFAITEYTMRSVINEAMLNSVQDIIEEMDLVSTDFYKKNGDTLSIDTVLINRFCNRVAADISYELNSINTQKIKIPVGVLTGIESLANYGPEITIMVRPIGGTVVDYDSSFYSAGINQVNLQIWLNIESGVQIVNPLQTGRVDVSRKISLVNTIITGEVPSVYLDGK